MSWTAYHCQDKLEYKILKKIFGIYCWCYIIVG
jgi:hypothetical protein